MQPGLLVGPLVADTWQKIVVPLADLGAANNPQVTDFWLQEITGVDGPVFYVDDVRLDLAPPPSVVNVTVHARNALRRVDARTFGLNTAIWDGALNTPTTVGLLQELDNQALRFPGGSISNVYHWKTNLSDGAMVPWATSFDAFAATATATHAQVFVTVNYGTGTPEEAADWVRHSNVESGYGFKYWEIGNENYGTWEVGNNRRPHDPVTYANRFAEYARQMKAVDPSIKIGAVIQASEDSNVNYLDEVVINPCTGVAHSGWSAVMLAAFRQLGVTPDFVAYHRYEQAPGGESDAFLLTASRGWADDAASIRQLLNDYLGAKAKRVEIDSTETNSVYAEPGKQSTSLVNGLFLADSMGNIMKTEINAFLWWDLRNSAAGGRNNSPSLYGWRHYGDYGIVNYANPAGPADRYPTFYVYKLLKNYARGGELVIDTTSDYDRLGVYAVRDSLERTLSLLIINKHPTRALATSVTIDGFRFGQTADIHSYGIPQDEAAREPVLDRPTWRGRHRRRSPDPRSPSLPPPTPSRSSSWPRLATSLGSSVVFVVDAGGAYRLTITKAGTGAGTVTTSPSGVSCGSTCSSLFMGGVYVILQARPTNGSGSFFTGWAGVGVAAARDPTAQSRWARRPRSPRPLRR